MIRKRFRLLFRGGAVLLVGYFIVSVVCSQIIPERNLIVNVTGEHGATISARVTVDGKVMDVSKQLPARFEYDAKSVLVEAVLSPSEPPGDISANLFVEGVETGTVIAPAGLGVRMGYKGPGLLGQGKSWTLASGFKASELEHQYPESSIK
jgi:hypothetical protein